MSDAYLQSEDYVTFSISDQLFGIPVLTVHDVLSPHRITQIPLAPPEIAGSLNLRGRIVTAIDIRPRLGLAKGEGRDERQKMNIVVENHGELYSLMVDTVGEVLSLSAQEYERNPPTLDPQLREYSNGVFRLKDKLLVVLNVDQLLDSGRSQAA